MNIGIKAISSYLPNQIVDNIEQGKQFDMPEDFVLNKIGAKVLPRMEENQDSSDLCVAAIKQLQTKRTDFDISKIDLLVVITQNGDKEHLPHTSAVVQQKANLPKTIAAFDVSLGCSGYVYGLYVVQGMLQATGLKQALLVTADPYSKIVDRKDRVTSMLFGDAATATWIGADPIFKLGKVLFATDGSGVSNLYVENSTLVMNGRQVFNFAATHIPAHIKALLADSCIEEEEIDAFIIHQGSAAIVDAIARRFCQPECFIKDLYETGNTVSSSIPLLIEKYAIHSHWQQIVISGFGVGLSWASALIYKSNKEES